MLEQWCSFVDEACRQAKWGMDVSFLELEYKSVPWPMEIEKCLVNGNERNVVV